jgi:hypothetical protein
MDANQQREQLRERYVIALIEATLPLQVSAEDREVTLEVLIDAAELLKQHLQRELEVHRTAEAET